MINIGIIGCGWIVEKAYLPILEKMDDVVISAVFDSDFKKTSEVRNKYNILNTYNDIRSFLSLSFDAAIIATPNNTHTYFTDLVLGVGKHVLCEKPVALSKKDVISSIEIAHTNKKIFLPAFVNRFRKDILKFSEIVSLIGEVKEVEVNWIRKSGIPRPGTWITNKEMAGGGVLMDIGTHVIDIGLTFLSDKRIQSVKLDHGTIEGVEQKGAPWNTNNEIRQLKFDVETWAKGEISFANGSLLRFSVDWSSDISEDITNIKVVGTDGIVSINTLFGFSNNFKRDDIEILYEWKNGETGKFTFPMNNMFALDAFGDLIRYFFDLINGQAIGILKPSDGVHIVGVIERLYQSV